MIEQLPRGHESPSVKEDSIDVGYDKDHPHFREVTEAPEAVDLPKLEADVAHAYEIVEAQPGVAIERRTPAVTEQNLELVNNPLVSREWTLVTEVVKRKLPQPDARAALKTFIDTPVSQHLAADMLRRLSQDPEVNSVLTRSSTHLRDMLAIVEIPEEAITPDIRTANILSDPLKDVADLRSLNRSGERIEELLKERSKKGAYTNALSSDEKLLLVRKYAFARDVKLLALGAELWEVGGVTLDDEGEAVLPSGTRLKVDDEHYHSSGFLDPSKWEYRRQFKDRVYEIGVDGKNYLLKERKTSRHRDTMMTGHRDGLTSSEEYELAALLNEKASVSEGEAQVSWEKPVGYVEYPDGFSFAVFEYEEGLLEDAPIAEIEEIIRNNPEFYQDEYEEVKAKLVPYLDGRLVKDAASAGRVKLPRRFGFFGKHESTLDYGVFAEAKARFLCRKVQDLMEEKALDHGYRNADEKLSGAYRISKGENGEAIVEMVGFDYELYRKYSPDQVEGIRRVNKKVLQITPWKFLPFELRDKPMQLAAYQALAEMDGNPIQSNPY